MTQDILVIHGMSGAAAEIAPLAQPLRRYGRVWTPDLIGHGGREIPEQLTMQSIGADLVAFMDRQGIERAALVGHSVGGLIALYLARHWPQRVAGVCAVASKYVIDRAVSERWLYLGDPERIARPGNPRAAQLERLHQPQDWRRMYVTNRRFYRELPDNPPLTDADLAAIGTPVKLVSADADPIVDVDEQKRMAALLRAELRIWPGSMHPLMLAPLAMAADIGDWIRKLPG